MQLDRCKAWGLALIPAAAALPAVILIGALLARPWETDRVEGFLDYAARKGLSPARIYPPVDEAWPYPQTYAPLHVLLTGALSRMSGADPLTIGRAVSVAGGILAAAGVFLLALTLGASRRAAAAGAVLLLSMNPQANFIGSSRTDPLAMGMAVLGGALLLKRFSSHGAGLSALILSCVLLAGSAFAHQRAVVVVAAFLVARWYRPAGEGEGGGFRGALPVLLTGLAALAGAVSLHLATDGRCWFYLLTLPGSAELSVLFSMKVFAEAGALWGAVIVAAALVLATSRSLRWFVPAGLLPLVANVYLCANTGSSRNYFLPVLAVACALLAAGLSRVDLGRRVRQACWVAFAASALGHAAWTTVYQIPSRLDLLARSRAAESYVTELKGKVFSSAYLVSLNRHRPDADQTFHVLWLTRRCAPVTWARHADRLRGDLERGTYEWVFLPMLADFPLSLEVLDRHYGRLSNDHPLSRAYGLVYQRVR